MQPENRELTNNIEIKGIVAEELTFSHEVYGEGFYNFSMEVPRLSDAADILPVTISERLLNGESLAVGTLVSISGQVRSYNNYVPQDNRNRLIITVFARELEIIEEDSDWSKSPNNVCLNGFICKPPIFRQTPFGREIADILLAVNRSYNKSDYIPCICWGRNARFVSGLNISDNIIISGRMQSRLYQKKVDDDTVMEKTAYEISVSKIELVQEQELSENSEDSE